MNRYWVIFLVALLHVNPAKADQLPKDAVPLTEKATRALVSGKSWKYRVDTCSHQDTGRITAFADGSFRGVADLKTKKPWAIFWGNWTVKGNEMCTYSVGITVDDIKIGIDKPRSPKEKRCHRFFNTSKGIYDIISYCSRDRKYGSNDYSKTEKRYDGDLSKSEFERLMKRVKK